jgi:predicted ester cyclase
MAAIEEYCAPDYVWHSPSPGVFPDLDRAGMKQFGRAGFTAFPDLHYTLEDLIAEGDKVVHRFTMRGTHQGEFMGVAATGKVVTMTGIYISRFAGGKCVEERSSSDILGLMQQVSAIPQMAQAGS